jgi:thiamine pyrophosphokinase
MKRCVIIGASPDVFWDGRWVPDIVICADGGARHAINLGLAPSLVIGDGDSADLDEPLPYPFRRLPAEKNMTDMEACLDCALGDGYDEIAIIGATGGRLDHFLGNIGLLERAGRKAYLLDGQHEIYLIASSLTIHPVCEYRYFSVIPLDEEALGVTITGGKYPLNNAVLRRDATVGISNEPLDGLPFSVSVEKGKVLLVLSGNKTHGKSSAQRKIAAAVRKSAD